MRDGWTSEEIRRRDLQAFFTSEDRVAGIADKKLESARAVRRGIDQRWHLRNNAERFWARSQMTPLAVPTGHPRAISRCYATRRKQGCRPTGS